LLYNHVCTEVWKPCANRGPACGELCFCRRFRYWSLPTRNFRCCSVYAPSTFNVQQWPVEVLSVETVAGGGKYLFQRFHPFVSFETIQNNLVWRRVDTKETAKWTRGGKVVYDDKV
jgi:hypothetical protein